MAKGPYLPKDDAGKAAWLVNLANKLPTHQATVNLSAGDVSSAAADAAFFSYALGAQQQVSAFAQQWTAYKNAARSGTGASMGPVPTPPTLGAAPTAVAPGIFGRATALVARIKTAAGYTEAIGQDLDIIGAEQTVDVHNLKPVLQVEMQAGHPVVKWKKQGMDGVEIHVDRGTGTFVFLALDTQPDYPDTAPLPAPGQSVLWRYKALYRLNDEAVGQWSDVASIAVTG